jgi:mannitol/fructose-specific phosphotransferase system IIA component (Ntr-type)
LGYDIALPHARLSNCDVFTLSIGRLAAPLYWGPDKKPVRFVFLAVVPSHLASAYLGLVKTLSKAAKENRIQKVLAEAVEPDAAGSHIRSILALK